jgi:hypothetical protein
VLWQLCLRQPGLAWLGLRGLLTGKPFLGRADHEM